MRTKVNSDGTISVTSELNHAFIDMMKKHMKNPFSVNILTSDIKIGMEFEFYVPLEGKTRNEQMDDREEKLNHLVNCFASYNAKMKITREGKFEEKDLNCAYLEKDATLEHKNAEGFEFVSPMLNLVDVPFYLKNSFDIIQDVGFSTSGCGVHFHISSEKLGCVDMAKLLTFLHAQEADLFAEYKDRSMWTKSLERVFLNSKVETFNDVIFTQSKHFDIALIGDNHIELRVLGGASIYEKYDEVLQKLDRFLNVYRIGCEQNLEVELYKELVNENIKSGYHTKDPVTYDEVVHYAELLARSNGWDKEVAFKTAFNELEKETIVNCLFDLRYKDELESGSGINQMKI